MKRAGRLGTSLSMLAVAAVISGCAVGQQGRGSLAATKVDYQKIGLATKAQAALAQQDYAAAVDFAERAVEHTPGDANFRALLGNCYFASGRFASAEQAYRDSISLGAAQPALVLKLALVQIAQGKTAQALGLLDSARGSLEPADYGLAIALAGRPAEAVAVLDQAARTNSADGRVRQNLALAYGLAGDWTMARTIAAQDVAPGQLDSRIQQWMAMATPSRASDQVAALTGVTPSADPGQPQRLALATSPQVERYAQVAGPASVMAPAPVAAPVPVAVAAAIPETPPPALPEPMPAEAVQPPVVDPVDVPQPVVAEAARSLVAPVTARAPAMDAPNAAPAPVEAVAEAPVRKLPTSFDAPVEPASFVAISDKVRRAAARHEKAAVHSNSVVQLGAYRSAERVTIAWEQLTRRFPALADYIPMRARFAAPGGTVWRLSIKGFASRREAAQRCELLQSNGGTCFVRTMAGDAPVQLASR